MTRPESLPPSLVLITPHPDTPTPHKTLFHSTLPLPSLPLSLPLPIISPYLPTPPRAKMKCIAFIATLLAAATTASAAAIPLVARQVPCPPPPSEGPVAPQPQQPAPVPWLPQPQQPAPWQPQMPTQPGQPQPWQPKPPMPTLPGQPKPWQPQQPVQPAPMPWTPAATIENAEGMVTATLGAKSCTLTEALPEGQTLPPTVVLQPLWGAEWAVVRSYPSGVVYSCKMEEAPADRR